MLYDEEGRAFVEEPLLPEEKHAYMVVKDYRRMYNLHDKMERKIKRLQETNTQMAHYNFFMRHKLKELLDVTMKFAKHIKNQGQSISQSDMTVIYDAECVVDIKKKKRIQKTS